MLTTIIFHSFSNDLISYYANFVVGDDSGIPKSGQVSVGVIVHEAGVGGSE